LNRLSGDWEPQPGTTGACSLMGEACPAARAGSLRPPRVRRAAAAIRRRWSCAGLQDPRCPAWLVRACIVVNLVAGVSPEEARAIWPGGRRDRCSTKEGFPNSSRLKHARICRNEDVTFLHTCALA